MYDLLELFEAYRLSDDRMTMHAKMWDELDMIDEDDHATMDRVFSKWDWNLRTLDHKESFGGVWGVEL